MVPSVYEDGTLYNVLPSGNKAPDETGNHNGYDQTRADFTFSRGSNLAATRVNADGLIEKGRENLLLQSNQFDTTWATNNASVTSGQSGYDGSSNAWKLQSSSAGINYLYQIISSNAVQTFSIYAKAGNTDWMRINILQSGTNANNYYDISNGVKGASPSAPIIDDKIESVGNGWYRISIVVNISITQIRIQTAVADGNETSASGDNIYIQSAQLEAGLVATDYIETGSTTAQAGILEDMPRINYDANGENGALLLEPSRSNFIKYANYYNGWGIKSGVTATTNTVTSPDGLQNASTIAATTSATNYIGEYYTFSASTKYTYSVFVKNNTSTKMRLQVYDSSQYATLDFDQSDSISYSANLDSYDFVDYGNGWRRVIISFTTSSGAGSGYVQIYPDRNGNNHSMYAFGAQLEAGSYVSSLIPTHGAAVTRGADSCSVTGVSDVIGQSEGVIFVDLADYDGNTHLVTLGDGTANNYIMIYISSGAIAWLSSGGFSGSAGSVSAGDKAALAYKQNDSVLYLNGTQVLSDTSNTIPNIPNIYLNANANVQNQQHLQTKQVVLFNERLSNSELADLTA